MQFIATNVHYLFDDVIVNGSVLNHPSPLAWSLQVLVEWIGLPSAADASNLSQYPQWQLFANKASKLQPGRLSDYLSRHPSCDPIMDRLPGVQTFVEQTLRWDALSRPPVTDLQKLSLLAGPTKNTSPTPGTRHDTSDCGALTMMKKQRKDDGTPVAIMKDCSGNCGQLHCAASKKRRGRHQSVRICQLCSNGEASLCVFCRCTNSNCAAPRRLSRYCNTHAISSMPTKLTQYMGPNGIEELPIDAPSPLIVVARFDLHFQSATPDDCETLVRCIIDSIGPIDGTVIDGCKMTFILLAHGIKWPPAVRYFYSLCKNALVGPNADVAVALIDNLIKTLRACSGRAMKNTHAAMSPGRMNAVTGLLVVSQNLGILRRGTETTTDDLLLGVQYLLGNQCMCCVGNGLRHNII